MLLAMCCMSHCLQVQKALQSHAAPSSHPLTHPHPLTSIFYCSFLYFAHHFLQEHLSVILVRLIPFLRLLLFSSHFLFLFLLARFRPSRCFFSVLYIGANATSTFAGTFDIVAVARIFQLNSTRLSALSLIFV